MPDQMKIIILCSWILLLLYYIKLHDLFMCVFPWCVRIAAVARETRKPITFLKHESLLQINMEYLNGSCNLIWSWSRTRCPFWLPHVLQDEGLERELRGCLSATFAVWCISLAKKTLSKEQSDLTVYQSGTIHWETLSRAFTEYSLQKPKFGLLGFDARTLNVLIKSSGTHRMIRFLCGEQCYHNYSKEKWKKQILM